MKKTSILYTKKALCLLLIFACLILGSCGKPDNMPGNMPGAPPEGMPGGPNDPMQGGAQINSEYSKLEAVEIEIPNEALSTGAVMENAIKITFDQKSAAVSPQNEGVSVNDGLVCITKAGNYLLTGVFSGQLQVNTEEDAEVALFLDGVQIVSPDSAALYVLSAPKKVTVNTIKGSKNIFEDGESYTLAEGSDEPSAALFSKEDLHFEGEGELFVTSHTCKGIYSKDDLKIKSGTISVVCADDGIRGKDSLSISGGIITVSSGTDALKTSNSEESDKGNLLISAGTITLSAGDDGMDAVGVLTILGGDISVLTGGGASANTSGGGNDFGGGGGGFGGGGGGRPPRSNGFEDTTAAVPTAQSTQTGGKGIKSDRSIAISGGTITVDSFDDALHSTELIFIDGGTINLAAGDDGIHCDKNVTISNGTLTVTRSYEGIEGQYITLTGGRTTVTASDDGFNATDGSSSGGMGGGFGGMMGAGQECTLTFDKDCYVVINASGDGLDSNGNAYQKGGTVICFGPTNSGNGAIDTGDGRDNGYFFTGGNLLAIGASGMAESIDSDLPFLYTNVSSLQAGTQFYILDDQGTCVLVCKAPKSFSNVVFASSSCEGDSFTLYSGGTTVELSDDAVFFPEEAPTGGSKVQTSSGGNGGFGGFRPF